MGTTRLLPALLVAGMLAVGGGASAATVPDSGVIPFSVFRSGDSPLGRERVTFTRDGDLLIVEKEIHFVVKAAFFVLFRYKHQNREVWQDGRLVSLDTTTDDDGKKFWVRGRATPDGFAVEGSGGSFIAPADVIPTSYWNVATASATRLLDTQRGLLMDVAVEQLGEMEVKTFDGPVSANGYRVNILTNKPGATSAIDLWYDRQGGWVKMAFDAKGERITYRLDSAPPPTQSAEATPR